MQRFQLPTTKCDADDAGLDITVSGTEATQALKPGWYKIAAIVSPVKWRIGGTAVAATTGSYLAANDQELIHIPGVKDVNGTLRVILDSSATENGRLNVVPVRLFEVPGTDPRKYTTFGT